MRILFLSHYFPPEGNAPATRTFEHTRRWVVAGNDVTVITCAPNVPHGRVYPNYKNSFFHKSVAQGINIIRVWTFIAANKGKGRRSFNYLSYFFSSIIAGLFISKPDILIATSPQIFCGCAGAVLAKLRRVPFILEVRDIWPDSIMAVNAIQNTFVLNWMLKVEQWLYRSATHIVTVGDGYKKILIQKGVITKKISIITNGANLEQFKHDQTKCKNGHRLICSFIGTLGMASGLEIVIRAATHLDSIKDSAIEFMLVGDGAEYESLQEKVKKAGIKRIKFTGLLNKDQIRHQLSITDICLIHLRKSELFKTVIPSKLFEAMASGVPVVMGVQGEAAGIVEDSQCGLVFEPENHLEFCDRILQLKEDHSERTAMGKRGRTYLEKHYNRDDLAAQYLEVIENLQEKIGS